MAFATVPQSAVSRLGWRIQNHSVAIPLLTQSWVSDGNAGLCLTCAAGYFVGENHSVSSGAYLLRAAG
jgi:hypothetical protein